ncbi:MAG: hypothetical protein WA906_05430 [Pacificimonas sp.]
MIALRETHSVAWFEGTASRRHRNPKVWQLLGEAVPAAIRVHKSFRDAPVFAQFVGFPRSGHSLVGALIDAHPDAAISHELDVMGLFHKGVPMPLIHGLIAKTVEDFADAGRYWNGFSYTVSGAHESIPTRPFVIGDKKGDGTVRHCAARPDLLQKVSMRLGNRARWILVTRNPFDNIATMSLRKGRDYDRLRIETDDGQFWTAVRTAQADGRIAAEVLDDIIDDYADLCRAANGMQAQISAAQWHQVVYEDFTTSVRFECQRLLAFLGLTSAKAYLSAANNLVRPAGVPSRDRIEWRKDQVQRVENLIAEISFLSPYQQSIR